MNPVKDVLVKDIREKSCLKFPFINFIHGDVDKLISALTDGMEYEMIPLSEVIDMLQLLPGDSLVDSDTTSVWFDIEACKKNGCVISLYIRAKSDKERILDEQMKDGK